MLHNSCGFVRIESNGANNICNKTEVLRILLRITCVFAAKSASSKKQNKTQFSKFKVKRHTHLPLHSRGNASLVLGLLCTAVFHLCCHVPCDCSRQSQSFTSHMRLDFIFTGKSRGLGMLCHGTASWERFAASDFTADNCGIAVETFCNNSTVCEHTLGVKGRD